MKSVAVFTICTLWICAADVRGDEGAFEPAPINVPDGYTVELAAAPPLVRHPIMAGFDERGRLFVAETAGLNLERKELEEQLPGFIRMLEDTDGDGAFDKSSIFADKLTFPQGALWHGGALYVASSGGIWRFEDTDGDDVADKRDLLAGNFGYTGNAADVHGCFLHPNGRIYWVGGRHGHEVRDDSGAIVSQSKAGGVFSMRPDGSDFRRHTTGGFDNPVELVFTEEGEALGTVNIFEHPPRQDCLVHWVEGGLYPRTDFVSQWDEFVSTGDLLPPVMSFGHVAVSGLASSRFDHSLYVTLFNTHEVRRVEMSREGSTYRAQVREFLSSPHEDFHPTDVLEDADGSLLVIDTGGWFRIGCPTSQIARPQALGAIYRVRWTGSESVADPRGLKLDWEGMAPADLARLLDDPRPAVRERAIASLAGRGDAALHALTATFRESANPIARRNALWAAVRIGGERAATVVRAASADSDESVRHAAVHGVGVLRDTAAILSLIQLVTADSPPICREAATALGQIGSAQAVPALLESLRDSTDPFIDHAAIHSLILINEPGATSLGLAHAHAAVRRGALIALDRMPSGQLQPRQVISAMDADDPALRKAALDILTRHPGWTDQAVTLLREWLSNPALSEQDVAAARGVLAAFATDPAALELVAAALAAPATPSPVRAMLLDVLAEHGPTQPFTAMDEPLAAALRVKEPDLLSRAIRVTERLNSDRWDARLLELSADSAAGQSVRIAALRSLIRRGHPLDEAAFNLLLSALNPATPLLGRRDAAQVIAAARLSDTQLVALCEPIRNAGPIELPLLLEAFEQRDKPQIASLAEPLFAALSVSPGLPAIELPRIESLAQRLGASATIPLLEQLRHTAASQRDRLVALERSLTRGDPGNGKDLFFSKATCFVCHRVRGEGGIIGTDLSTIGAIRGQRDLLEAIAFPSASFARGYEPITVTLTSGESLFGRLARETQDAIILADAQGIEHRLPRNTLRQITPSTISLMPQGLETLLTPQELSDLIAYLQSLR